MLSSHQFKERDKEGQLFRGCRLETEMEWGGLWFLGLVPLWAYLLKQRAWTGHCEAVIVTLSQVKPDSELRRYFANAFSLNGQETPGDQDVKRMKILCLVDQHS